LIAGGAEMNREMQRVEAAVVQRWGESCWTEVVWGGVCFIASLIAGYTAGWGGSRLLVVLGRKLKGGSRVGSAVVRRPSRKMKGVVVRWCAQPGQAWRAGVGVIGARGTI